MRRLVFERKRTVPRGVLFQVTNGNADKNASRYLPARMACAPVWGAVLCQLPAGEIWARLGICGPVCWGP